MYWRFEDLPGEAGKAPLLYDDVRHLLRAGNGTWVRLPHHPALILSLLLRMQTHGYTVSAREMCAFLVLPAGTRVSGHITELRKKIAECGVDSAHVIEPNETKAGYRLAAGVRAVPLEEADVRQVIDELLAKAETATERPLESEAPQRRRLLEMLLLCAVAALAFTGWVALRPRGEEPIARLDPEEGQLEGKLVPHRACFELARELALGEQDVLALEVSRLSASAASRIVVSVERERREDGAAAVQLQLGPEATSTLRIEGRQLEPGIRSHARRICVNEQAGIGLRAVRIE